MPDRSFFTDIPGESSFFPVPQFSLVQFLLVSSTVPKVHDLCLPCVKLPSTVLCEHKSDWCSNNGPEGHELVRCSSAHWDTKQAYQDNEWCSWRWVCPKLSNQLFPREAGGSLELSHTIASLFHWVCSQKRCQVAEDKTQATNQWRREFQPSLSSFANIVFWTLAYVKPQSIFFCSTTCIKY